MRFRESAAGQTILRMPCGEQILSLGKSAIGLYYWCKHRHYRELFALPWIVCQSRDDLTRRILTNRLTESEATQRHLLANLRCVDGPLLVRPNSTDRKVIREIFAEGEYRPVHGWTYRTVLDCGANGGLFAVYAQSQAKGILQAYIGVEPDPESFELLTAMIRVRGMQPMSTLWQVAVAGVDGSSTFDTRGDSWQHRLSDQGQLRVQTLSINSLLDQTGLHEVDLLKLDIEGGEKEVLESWPTWRNRVRCVVVELHDVWDHLDFDWFASLARASGFTPMPPGALFRRLPSAIRDDVGET